MSCDLKELAIPLAALLLLTACPDEPPKAPAIDRDVGAADAGRADAGLVRPGDPKVGGLGEVQVLLSDYDKALTRSTIFAPEPEVRAVPPDLLKAPHFQHRTVINMLDIMLTRQLAVEHGVEVTDEDIEAYLQSDKKLARFARLGPAERQTLLQEFGLGLADLNEVCRDRLLTRKLSEVLAPAPDDETLWAAYKRDKERIQLNFVAVSNTPTSQGIDRYVKAKGPTIEAYYKGNPKDFAVPASRKVRILRLSLPRTASGAEVAEVRERLDALRIRALGGEDFAELVKAHSQHPNASSGGSLGHVVRRQRPEAFGVKVGELTEPARDKEGLYILKIEEELPPHVQPMTSATQREIAARLLRQDGPIKEPLEEARAIALAWSRVKGGPQNTSEELDELLTRRHLRRGKTFPFSTDVPDDAFISGIGRSPEIMRAARGLTLKDPVRVEPILFKGKLYVLALVMKGEATRAAFEVEREAFEVQWLRSRRAQVIAERTEALKRASRVYIDLQPIHDKYGVLRDKTQ